MERHQTQIINITHNLFYTLFFTVKLFMCMRTPTIALNLLFFSSHVWSRESQWDLVWPVKSFLQSSSVWSQGLVESSSECFQRIIRLKSVEAVFMPVVSHGFKIGYGQTAADVSPMRADVCNIPNKLAWQTLADGRPSAWCFLAVSATCWQRVNMRSLIYLFICT